MTTPIAEFVLRYRKSGTLRLHMPGHKGHGSIERDDITEIGGADSLYEASGIIRESERNASEIFGFPTYYSTEGSTQCIKAMLYLVTKGKKRPFVLAGRNAHKAFMHAAALLDFMPVWFGGDYLSCEITAAETEKLLSDMNELPAALYLTSPDYLGNTLRIEEIASVCKRYGVPLLVDNAHGAYLGFLKPNKHPIALGASFCASSAHKTLPVLTGGAYLQTSDGVCTEEEAKAALSIFGSTSPSYLILSSLDSFNARAGEFSALLKGFSKEVEEKKRRLKEKGLRLVGNEPLKLTVAPKSYGYTGTELAAFLRKKKIECEFADNDYLVCMLSPLDEEGTNGLFTALSSLPKKDVVTTVPPAILPKKRVLSPREAMFSESEVLPVSLSKGRILAQANVACPPAVPILCVGEEIDENAIASFEYYGIKRCAVVKGRFCKD